MYTHQQLEASRGGITLPVEPAPTPIAYAVHVAAFIVCIPFAGSVFGLALIRVVLA